MTDNNVLNETIYKMDNGDTAAMQSDFSIFEIILLIFMVLCILAAAVAAGIGFISRFYKKSKPITESPVDE